MNRKRIKMYSVGLRNQKKRADIGSHTANRLKISGPRQYKKCLPACAHNAPSQFSAKPSAKEKFMKGKEIIDLFNISQQEFPYPL